MRSRSRQLSTAILAATFLVLAGCEEQGLTRQQLVSRGDRVCKRTAERLNPLFTKLFPTGEETPPAPEAAPTMNEAARLVRQEAEALSRLEPQEQLEDDFRPIVRGLREGAGVLEESARLASGGDTEGYLAKLQEANRVDQDTRDLMVEFGFTDCGGAT
jgi:hypothetical protein